MDKPINAKTRVKICQLATLANKFYQLFYHLLPHPALHSLQTDHVGGNVEEKKKNFFLAGNMFNN